MILYARSLSDLGLIYCAGRITAHFSDLFRQLATAIVLKRSQKWSRSVTRLATIAQIQKAPRYLVVVCCLAPLGCAVTPESAAQAQEALQRADSAYGSGQWQAARTAYEDALRHDPDNANLWLRLANIGQHEGRWDDAQKNYRRVLELAPKDQRAHYNLAVLYLTRAERHFQYFSALSELDSHGRLTSLLAAMEKFAAAGHEPTTPLEQLGQRLRRSDDDVAELRKQDGAGEPDQEQ